MHSIKRKSSRTSPRGVCKAHRSRTAAESRGVLMENRVSFLGHMIDEAGVRTDPRKTDALRNYLTPKNVELRTFLGMAAFYRKICLNFAKTASVLHELTSPKRVWNWTKSCEGAFERLTQMNSSAPVLCQPDIARARTKRATVRHMHGRIANRVGCSSSTGR